MRLKDGNDLQNSVTPGYERYHSIVTLTVSLTASQVESCKQLQVSGIFKDFLTAVQSLKFMDRNCSKLSSSNTTTAPS